MPEGIFKTKRIMIEVLEHKHTNLLVAYSKDLPGLTVAARSREQLFREVPDAIKELLEASGMTSVTVEADETDDLPTNFIRNCMVAKAAFAHVDG